jgi:hypothetical protein
VKHKTGENQITGFRSIIQNLRTQAQEHKPKYHQLPNIPIKLWNLHRKTDNDRENEIEEGKVREPMIEKLTAETPPLSYFKLFSAIDTMIGKLLAFAVGSVTF